MKNSWKHAAALAVCLCLFYPHAAQAQLFSRSQTPQRPTTVTKQKSVVKKDSSVQQAIAAMEKSEKGKNSATLVDYNTFEASDLDGVTPYYQQSGGSSSCASCFSGCSCECGGGGGGFLSRPGELFFVGEYIYVRPSLSEALAYIYTDQSNQPLEPAEYVEFDFDYQSSYRFSGGYRMCDCCAEIVFNYARYQGEASFDVQDTVTSSVPVLRGPYAINAPLNGGFLVGDADIDIQSYDIGVAKTIPLGSRCGVPRCDGCCGSCSDTCCDTCCGNDCCGGCPSWDIVWSAGVRFADADWAVTRSALENDRDLVDSSLTTLTFEGVGARAGLLGRRYFGRRGCFSLYAKGDLSILVGDMEIQASTFDAGTQLTTGVHYNKARRVIPVTEIEAGATAHLGNHVSLSAGYLLSAWHDLGFRDESSFADDFPLLLYDDANILGFDGFFARAEVAF